MAKIVFLKYDFKAYSWNLTVVPKRLVNEIVVYSFSTVSEASGVAATAGSPDCALVLM